MHEKSLSQTMVMIVEDNLDLLETLKSLLEMHNYKVVTAKNGRDCLKELENGFRGIIVLDVMMPVMDGISTIRHMVIEGFVEYNKIILLTAKKIQSEDMDDIYPYIYKLIQKPFDIDEFLLLIDEVRDQVFIDTRL
jgi:DNA-binding response OmpR family regulator